MCLMLMPFLLKRCVKVCLLSDFAKKYVAFFVYELLSASVREVY